MDKNSSTQCQNTWHDQSADSIFCILQTAANGLSFEQAESRVLIYGPNRLVEAKPPGRIVRFMRQFHNILIYVLMIAGIITAALQHYTDTIVILAVIIVNAIVGYIQEGKAESAINAIKMLLALKSHVVRDNVRTTIDSTELVPGDVVLLEAGDKVPADVRIFEARGLQIQEAILTGESVPIDKQVDQLSSQTILAERTCMAYSGTLVTSGQAKGVVVATGATTEIGRISGMLANIETLTTPLVANMARFAKVLTAFILAVATLLFIYGYFSEYYTFESIFITVVAIAVAAIPAGLPTVLTITLAVGVQAMARRHAIIRRLPAIETLGSVSVICSDKTGTLTCNEMTVATIGVDRHSFTLDSVGYGPEGTLRLNDQVVDSNDHNILLELARCAVLCNDAELHEEKEMWSVVGDPMEGALLSFAHKIDYNVKEDQANWLRTDTIPFDSKHAYMATLNHNHEQKACIFVKGAPEKILAMCRTQRTTNNTDVDLDKSYWQEHADQTAASGQRVLAFAIKPVPLTHTTLQHNDLHQDLIFIGMVGMIDPPRPEVIVAIDACKDAGIIVKMITGDHALTAAAIGKRLGLENADRVLTGSDMDDITDELLQQVVLNYNIFARATPEHKLRLVIALQTHDMTVAMTGDGVNDAPALKRADVGIAMGLKGSEAAKDASELVLADDNFSSIVAAVQEGRTVYDNIVKVISWTLPTNAGEAMTLILAIILHVDLPVTAIQILWINLITAVTLGLALAFEPTEKNSMRRPPRKRSGQLLTPTLAWHTIFVSILFVLGTYGMYNYALVQGYSLAVANTIALNTVVILEIFHLFFIRNIYSTSLKWHLVLGTKILWTTLVIVTIAQFAITYIPIMQRTFGTDNVSLVDGILIFSVGVMMFAILESEKQIRLRFFTN